MRKLLLALSLLLVSLSTPVFGQNAPCPNIYYELEAFADEALTVSSTSLALTSATHQPGTNSNNWAQMAILVVETNSIRIRSTGSAPTSSVGQLVQADSQIILCGTKTLTNFRMIRVSSDAPVYATYFRRRQFP